MIPPSQQMTPPSPKSMVIIEFFLQKISQKNLLMLAVVTTASYSILISSMPSIVFIYLYVIL